MLLPISRGQRDVRLWRLGSITWLGPRPWSWSWPRGGLSVFLNEHRLQVHPVFLLCGLTPPKKVGRAWHILMILILILVLIPQDVLSHILALKEFQICLRLWNLLFFFNRLGRLLILNWLSSQDSGRPETLLHRIISPDFLLALWCIRDELWLVVLEVLHAWLVPQVKAPVFPPVWTHLLLLLSEVGWVLV